MATERHSLEGVVNGRSSSGPVCTTPKEFKNGGFFLRLGLPSTLIRHENGAFQKRSSNQKNLKTPAFRSRVDGKSFENTLNKLQSHERRSCQTLDLTGDLIKVKR